MRYSDTVMDHFMNPRNTGALTDCDGIGRIGTSDCGDSLQVWIKVQDDRLAAVRHQVFGCPAAIAACSIMTELATGLTLAEALALTDADVAKALGGLPPEKEHCSNLAATALHKAIENYQTIRQNPTDSVRITMLVNNAMPKPLTAEHGLSYWIEYGSQKILFDTGQTNAVVENAELLDIDLSQTDAIVLSHGHYDHTGGLQAVLERAPEAVVYLHPDAPKVRYSCPPGKPAKDISMPPGACQRIAEAASQNRLVYTQTPESVCPGIIVTGSVPRITHYEDTGGPFFLDKQAQTPDALLDDQALTISTAKGIVVILGCAHAGVVNTLDHIASLTPQPIYAVLGGTHLRAASKDRIEKTFAALKQYNIQLIAPCHCTGEEAIGEFKNHFQSMFLNPADNICLAI